MISGAAGDLTGIRELGELSHWGLRSVHHEFFSISPQMGLQDLSTMSKKEQTAIVISGEAIADDSVAELGLREVRRESCGLTQGSCGAAVWVKLDEYPV